jgi:hypothetical protein
MTSGKQPDDRKCESSRSDKGGRCRGLLFFYSTYSPRKIELGQLKLEGLAAIGTTSNDFYYYFLPSLIEWLLGIVEPSK